MRRKLKITLYSTNSVIRSAIRTAFKGFQYNLLEVTDGVKPPQKGINEEQQVGAVGRLNLPGKVDFVISTSALNRDTERLAANLAMKQNRNDVFAVVLPEGLDYLRNKLDKYGELVLVGADQTTV